MKLFFNFVCALFPCYLFGVIDLATIVVFISSSAVSSTSVSGTDRSSMVILTLASSAVGVVAVFFLEDMAEGGSGVDLKPCWTVADNGCCSLAFVLGCL